MYKNLFILFLLLCSYEQQRTDNPLLKGNQYTLWYLKDSGNAIPEFLYIDCYGKFYKLGFDTQTGYFFPMIENSFAGKWKYDSDTSIYLNGNLYSMKRDTYIIEHEYEEELEKYFYNEYLELIFLINPLTNDQIALRETNFPMQLIKSSTHNMNKI